MQPLSEGSRVARIVVEGHCNSIRIGANHCLAGRIVSECNDGMIDIGSSNNHSIIDVASGKRINRCKPISIGDHVWIGRQATILKGTVIGSHSIIGAGSIVRGTIPDHSLAAGSPAKVIRSGVTWDRRRLPV